ncbi:MAG: hypothetical protein WAM15_02130 [Candidatus Acidiferrales bacterium]
MEHEVEPQVFAKALLVRDVFSVSRRESSELCKMDQEKDDTAREKIAYVEKIKIFSLCASK